MKKDNVERRGRERKTQAGVGTKCTIPCLKQTAVDYGGEINMLDYSHFSSA
jgi:hypothetical protein